MISLLSCDEMRYSASCGTLISMASSVIAIAKTASLKKDSVSILKPRGVCRSKLFVDRFSAMDVFETICRIGFFFFSTESDSKNPWM